MPFALISRCRFKFALSLYFRFIFALSLFYFSKMKLKFCLSSPSAIIRRQKSVKTFSESSAKKFAEREFQLKKAKAKRSERARGFGESRRAIRPPSARWSPSAKIAQRIYISVIDVYVFIMKFYPHFRQWCLRTKSENSAEHLRQFDTSSSTSHLTDFSAYHCTLNSNFANDQRKVISELTR